MSPIATDPTWSVLTPSQRAAHADGPALWRDLIEVLSPDVVFISVAQPLLSLMSTTPMEWKEVHIGQRDRVIRTTGVPHAGWRSLAVFGRCRRVPFGDLTTAEKAEVGRLVAGRMIRA